MQNVQGGTTGSQPKPGAQRPPVLDQQPTVISSRAPLNVLVRPETTPPAGSDEASPARLGQFELTEFVGGGGMGRVFRGYDTDLARTVAVKVLPREQAADEAITARFRNEAQSAARLNHENIVQVYHVGEADGLPYIVFEFVEGVNIRALVERKGALPLAEALSYTYQVARALAHAAASGVVHRDVKPSNVLVTKDGRVKLIDMGLARVQRPPDAAADLTASGVTLGTFDYISPEQARDPRTADVRSDLYSLGCTLFFMLTGRPPFPEGTVLQKLLQHQGERPPNVRESRPELPEGVSHLLQRMMAKDPRRRFQTPAELIDGLAVLADEVGLAPARLGPPGWVVPRRPKLRFLQRHVPWLAPLALLLATVLALQFLRWPSSDPGDAAAMLIGMAEEPAPAPPEPGASPAADKTRSEPSPRPVQSPSSSSALEKPEGAAGPSANGTGGAAGSAEGPDTRKAAGPLAVESVPPKAAGPEKGGGRPATPRGKTARLSMPSGTTLRPATADGGLSLSDPMAAGTWASGDFQSDRGELTAAVGSPLAPTPTPAPAMGEAAKGLATSVLVVDGTGARLGRFATLQAACRAAANNDVIELRYNGPREERPIALGNVKLTIRAGRGFQPVVVFRPSGPDPVEYPRAMITLTGSHLALVDVPVEMVIPREIPADGWSLLELRQAELTRMEKCILTIRNASPDQGASHQDVAFFRVKPPPGSDESRAESRGLRVESSDSGVKLPSVDSPLSTLDSRLSLSNCIVRGEAVVLRVQHGRGLQFAWTNGLLVTSEQFLVADGSQRDVTAGELLKIDLQHVTAVVRGGLCRFVESDSAPRQVPAQFDVSNCILVGSSAAPLIEQTGLSAADAPRQRIVWNGDRNFYEAFSVFWDLQFAGPQKPPESMAFEAWQTHWGPEQEIRPAANRVQWRHLPAADRPLHTDGPADYALSPASPSGPNPAAGAASDGRDAGAQMDRLPEVPPLSPDK